MGGASGAANVNNASDADVDVDDDAGGGSPGTGTGTGTGGDGDGGDGGSGGGEAASPDPQPELRPEAGAEPAAGAGDEPEPGPGAEPGTSLLARPWVLLPFYVLVAAVLTWPLVAHLTDALSLGTEPTSTVPLFNLWTLEWNRAQIADLYANYWDAPLFHPTSGAFALSEPQPLTGLAYAPVAWLGGNPVLAYNLVSLAILALNG
jgi:hypothetical protein